MKASTLLAELEQSKILGGIALGRFFEGHDNDILIAVTELHTREHLDQFVSVLDAAVGRGR